MLTRKIGSIVRGKATPFHLVSACVLGSALGFLPGFGQAPGLIAFLVLLLIVVNANLLVAVLAGVAAEVVSLPLMSVSFGVGRVLIDGPTSGLLKALINAPVLALFGFEYYVTTGGLLLGVIFGLVLSVIVVKGITAFRRKTAALEEGSEGFRRLTQRRTVRFLLYVFVGRGHGKSAYGDLLEVKMGNPIRPIGVVFAAMVVGLLAIAMLFLRGPIVTMALQRGLERANGATVDIESADLDLGEGQLRIRGLAIADPSALDTDLFRTDLLEADVSDLSLLRKRLKLDRIVISGAAHGTKRAVPGHLVGKPPPPAPAPPDADGGTISDYLDNAAQWQRRLAQVRRWLDKLSGPAGGDEDAKDGDPLGQQARLEGYRFIKAEHVITEAPAFHVGELLIERLTTDKVKGETLTVTGSNLSTHPGLLDRPPQLAITSSGGTLDLKLKLGQAAAVKTENTIDLGYRGLSTDDIGQHLQIGGVVPIQGGTIDLAVTGQWWRAAEDGQVRVDLPLAVTLNNTALTVAAGSAEVDQLKLTLGVTGALSNPRISFDRKQFADALVQAGAAQLAGRVRGEADKLIEKGKQQLGDELGERLGDEAGAVLGDKVGGLLGAFKKKKDE